MAYHVRHTKRASYSAAGLLVAVIAAEALYSSSAFATPIGPFFKLQSTVIIIGATEGESKGGVTPVVLDFNLLTPTSSSLTSPDNISLDRYVLNANSGFNARYDFLAGTTRLIVDNETAREDFGILGSSDIYYLEASDTLSAFSPDNAADINARDSHNASRFLVVSNARFDIYSQASNLTRTGDFAVLDYENISYRALIKTSGGSGTGRWGDAAQNPAVGGGGIDDTIDDLSDMTVGPMQLFEGGRRTAKTTGSLLDQAVSFNIHYALSDVADASTARGHDFSIGTGTLGADVTYTIYTP